MQPTGSIFSLKLEEAKSGQANKLVNQAGAWYCKGRSCTGHISAPTAEPFNLKPNEGIHIYVQVAHAILAERVEWQFQIPHLANSYCRGSSYILDDKQALRKS